MNQNQVYIKLPKIFIKENMNTKNKKGLLLSYLFFHTTYDQEIYTSMDCICSELYMSTKSHGVRRSQNIIKDYLVELMSEKIINFIPTEYCQDFNSVANNQLFKISLNRDHELFNWSAGYVRIEKYEYDHIMSIKDKQTNKIFNIFYQIKSHICMDEGCLHTCYPSIKTLCKLCECSDNTLSSTIKTLYTHKLIYLYKFNSQEKVSINRNIEYVFALENYSKKQVLNEFVA